MASLPNYRRNDKRPRTLAACLSNDGDLDMGKYQDYVRSQAELSRQRITNLVAASYDEHKKSVGICEEDLDEAMGGPKEKRTRQRRGVLARKTVEGGLEVISPQQSVWYQMYVDNLLMEEEEFYQEKFRRRFRLPYENYLELVADCKEAENFSRWNSKKSNQGHHFKEPH